MWGLPFRVEAPGMVGIPCLRESQFKKMVNQPCHTCWGLGGNKGNEYTHIYIYVCIYRENIFPHSLLTTGGKEYSGDKGCLLFYNLPHRLGLLLVVALCIG